MKTTTNYGLKLPEGTDYISIDDINDNMEIIDQEMAGLVKKSGGDTAATVVSSFTTSTAEFPTPAAGETAKVRWGKVKKFFSDAVEAIEELKKSVSDGKSLLAAAITAKNVDTDEDDSFETMAANIESIVLGGGTASASDILSGKTKINEDGTTTTGTMTNKAGTTSSATPSLDTTNSRLVYTIPANAYYSTASKLYAAYSTIRSLIGLTAAKLATGVSVLGLTGTYKGVGTATASKVLKGYTFSTSSLSGADGEMPNLSDDATITHTSSNSTKVIVGDAAFASTNSDGTNRVQIRYAGDAGYITSNTLFGIAYSTLATAISLTAAKLGYGKSCLGITGTYKPTVKQLSAFAYRGFNLSSSDYNTSESESYTCTAAGTCYYNGVSASYNGAGTATCEIYKNGSVVNSRNIDSSNDYITRGTMVKQSFSVASGDVIKVSATATAGSHTMAEIDATIVTYP